MHHRSYDRLGAELDDDLEVLCPDCHETEHIEATAKSDAGIFLKLASEALRASPFSSIADLAEDTKQLCAQHHVPYDSYQIHRALELITGSRLKRVWRPPALRHVLPDPAVLTAQEVHEIFCRLGLAGLLKSMPQTMTDEEQLAHEAKVREQANAFRCEPRPWPKRVPIREQIDAIFAGTSR